MDATKLFKNGVTEYQPAAPPGASPLERETGSPQVSYDNVRRLMADGWKIVGIFVGPTGVLFGLEAGAERYIHYAPGLHVGHDDLATELVACLAAEAEYGQYLDLLNRYRCPTRRYYVGKLEPHDDLQAPSDTP